MDRAYNPGDHSIDLPNGQTIPPHDSIEIDDEVVKEYKAWMADMGLHHQKSDKAASSGGKG